MPFRISCELCGTSVEAERRSRQYCPPCRPKAVVLNSICRNLNLAAQADPVLMNTLMDVYVANDSNMIGGAFPALETVERFSPMVILAMALNDYGSISWDGTRFEIVRWNDRLDEMWSSGAPVNTGVDAANAADTFRRLNMGDFVSPEERAHSEHVSPAGQQRLDGFATGRGSRSRATGLSPSDRGAIIGPGGSPRRIGPMIYRPNDQDGFDHIGYANPEGDEIFLDP